MTANINRKTAQGRHISELYTEDMHPSILERMPELGDTIEYSDGSKYVFCSSRGHIVQGGFVSSAETQFFHISTDLNKWLPERPELARDDNVVLGLPGTFRRASYDNIDFAGGTGYFDPPEDLRDCPLAYRIYKQEIIFSDNLRRHLYIFWLDASFPDTRKSEPYLPHPDPIVDRTRRANNTPYWHYNYESRALYVQQNRYRDVRLGRIANLLGVAQGHTVKKIISPARKYFWVQTRGIALMKFNKEDIRNCRAGCPIVVDPNTGIAQRLELSAQVQQTYDIEVDEGDPPREGSLPHLIDNIGRPTNSAGTDFVDNDTTVTLQRLITHLRSALKTIIQPMQITNDLPIVGVLSDAASIDAGGGSGEAMVPVLLIGIG